MDFANNSEEALLTMQDELEDKLQEILLFLDQNIMPHLRNSDLLLHGRVKKTTSLREKIIRKNYHNRYSDSEEFINDLPDIIGIRLVCLLKDEEKQVFDSLRELLLENEGDYYYLKDHKNNSLHINFEKKQPELQKNGKEIYRIAGKWIDENGKITNVELQIKSLVHMFWGEIEHLLFYKNYSYIIGVDFYKKVIESTYSMLTSIDSQLKVMRQQLYVNEEEEQLEQLSQILTKFLYSFFNQNFVDSHGCKIDLREAYELIAQIKFEEITDIKEAKNLMQLILLKLTDENKITGPKMMLNEKSRQLAKNLKVLEEEDAFWSAFFTMYCSVIIETEEVHLNEVAVQLMRNFLATFELSRYSSNEYFKPLKMSMLDGVVNAFLKYRKMDYFIHKIHGKWIVEVLTEFLSNWEQYISEWDEKEFEEKDLKNQFHLIAYWIELLILSKLKNEEIKLESLNYLRSLIAETPIIWPLGIEIEKLDSLIRNGTVISYNELIKIIDKNGGETNDKKEIN